MLTAVETKKLAAMREAVQNKLRTQLPSPEEAKKMRWKPLMNPDGTELVGYMKPNGDLVFTDGTVVRSKAVEVDPETEVDEV